MLDVSARKLIDPLLNRIGAALARAGVTPDAVTLSAFGTGLVSAAMIAQGQMLAGLVLLLVSRIGDGLDGAVARASRSSDYGGFLDIVLDFVFYGAIPLAFVLHDPAANGVAGAFLIFTFYVNGASFLAYAVIAEKRKIGSDAKGPKSIYFTTGLAEATETYAVFAIFCLWPESFPLVAVLFGVICLYTALSRIMLARSVFGSSASET